MATGEWSGDVCSDEVEDEQEGVVDVALIMRARKRYNSELENKSASCC